MARTELQGYVARGGKDEYLTAFALNEWETQEWRQKIDTQKGASVMVMRVCVCGRGWGGRRMLISWFLGHTFDDTTGSILATQLRNNSFKLAKWAAQSILAGADLMKIGCVYLA